MMEVFSHAQFWIYAVVGFAAQMVDGALGMAYGTLATAVLLSTGVAPVIVSASVHGAQFFTTGLSAISHSWFRNVNRRLFLILALAGSLGGMTGAMLLTRINGDFIRPWIAGYLVFLGLLILWKRFRHRRIKTHEGRSEDIFRAGLGLIGGFLDALGGGWGPMVTSNLIARDEDPRRVIGSVNTAEFFVKTFIAATLSVIMTTDLVLQFQDVLLGLLVGGVIAAPFGAWIMRFIRPGILMSLVGLLVVALSGMTLYRAVF